MLSEEAKQVKKELENFNQLKRKLRILQNEYKNWKEFDNAIHSVSFEAHSDGGEKIPYAEKRIIKMEELEEMISKVIDEALEQESKFLQDILQLDMLSQNLLMERYMTGKPLKKIIREFNYSESHIFRLYDNAIENISKNRKHESK